MLREILPPLRATCPPRRQRFPRLDCYRKLIKTVTDLPILWDFPDLETAMKGMLSAGPAVKAVQYSGYEKANEALSASVKPYIQSDGHVRYHNKFRIVLAQ